MKFSVKLIELVKQIAHHNLGALLIQSVEGLDGRKGS
jgi:hypothetical protein